MAGFKSFTNAAITIAGIELARRIRKGQFSFGLGHRGRHRKRNDLVAIEISCVAAEPSAAGL